MLEMQVDMRRMAGQLGNHLLQGKIMVEVQDGQMKGLGCF